MRNPFKPKDLAYRITLIIITQGGRFFFKKVRSNHTDFNVSLANFDYKVRKEGLYELSVSPVKTAFENMIKNKEYYIVFREGHADHLGPKMPEVSSVEMYGIGRSTTLREGLNEKFREGLNSRGLIMILVIMAIAYMALNYLGYV